MGIGERVRTGIRDAEGAAEGGPETAGRSRGWGTRVTALTRKGSWRARAAVPALVTALTIPAYVWWATALATGGGDLAAQLAWSGFAARHPGSAYNLSWYGGAHTANYSLLTPWLMSWFGVRAVTVAAGTASTWLFARLFVRAESVRNPWWPALLGALTLWCDVASGRTTFAVGVAFGLGACLWVRESGALVVERGARRGWGRAALRGESAALYPERGSLRSTLGAGQRPQPDRRPHPGTPAESTALAPERRPLLRALLAAAAAALATAASPVAGLFLVVGGVAYALDRRWLKAAALLLPPVVIVGATTLLFPFEGEQPMWLGKVWMPLAVSAVLVCAAPRGRGWRVVRFGAAVYGLGVVLTDLVASPVGTNVERLFGLAGPPVLLAAALARPAERTLKTDAAPGTPDARPAPGAHSDKARRAHRLRRTALVLACLVSFLWLGDKTIADLRVSTAVPAWAASTGGVVAELSRLGADRTRVEVVPARNHREAAVLAAHVNTARGWNRQLDVERGRLFYDGSLNQDTYRAWLDHWAVGFVVLHDGLPDGPAEAEAALVRAGPSRLEPVWHDAHWTVYRVRDATPLVSPPGTALSGDDAELVVRMDRPGSATVRIVYSPWLRAKGARVERAPDGWTRLTATAPGTYRLGSNYLS
ncbi:hypothetical protein [Streptomyces sp. NBC_00212]|uniref:hypothetical protein n=1 Tax=Streptomyces sp. NBC_00212 TaxID=2975684 RepID=UPI0032438B70